MRKRIARRIFEQLWRGDWSSTGGGGLGLPIDGSRDICRCFIS